MTSGDVLLCDLNPVAGRVGDDALAAISRYLHLFIA
jgi:hypothetical protein